MRFVGWKIPPLRMSILQWTGGRNPAFLFFYKAGEYMAEETMTKIDWFDIKTVEQGVIVLEQLKQKLLVLAQQFGKTMKELRKSIQQRLIVQLRNELLALAAAFRVDSLEDFNQASAIFGQELAGALYQANLGFVGLKNAIVRAAAPIVQVLLPAVMTAVAFLTQLASVVGRVISFLFTGSDQVQDYADGFQSAASSSKALQKSLAGFDQITRLNGKNSGAFAGANNLIQAMGSWKSIIAKMQELFKPLEDLDFTAAAASLERLRKAAEPLCKELFAGLEWAWNNIFVPLAKWTVTELLPVFLDTLTTLLQSLSYVIEELRPDFEWLWNECLQPLAQWAGDQIIADLEGINAELNRGSDWLGLNQGPVDKFIDSIRNIIQAIGQLAQKIMQMGEESVESGSAMELLMDSVLAMFNPFQEAQGLVWLITSAVQALGDAFDDVTASANGAQGAMDDLGSNGWGNLKSNLIDPACSGVRQAANKVIDVVNGVMRVSASGINFIGNAIKALEFTVPSWVPGIGGSGFSFSFKPIVAPQIPYLAKGAVLPANRPFMAVVGDQKHGTNVEAPLAVIQQAVSAVMEDYSAANMAGHEATVAVLRELLEAVLGISIGDDVIAGAVSRYQGKMAVVRGG